MRPPFRRFYGFSNPSSPIKSNDWALFIYYSNMEWGNSMHMDLGSWTRDFLIPPCGWGIPSSIFLCQTFHMHEKGYPFHISRIFLGFSACFFRLSASTGTEVKRQLTVVCHQGIRGFSASDSLAKDRVDFWRSFKQMSHPLEILLEKSMRKFMSSLSPSHGTPTRTHLTRAHVRPVQLDVHSTGLRVVYNIPSKWIRIIQMSIRIFRGFSEPHEQNKENLAFFVPSFILTTKSIWKSFYNLLLARHNSLF